MKFFVLFFILFGLSFTAIAENKNKLDSINKKFGPMDQISSMNIILRDETDQPQFDFRGIVALDNCSASIVSLKGMVVDNALILTNGHCVGSYLNQGTALGNVVKIRQVNILNQDAKVVGTTTTTKLIYATMTNTDLALYELNMTYKEIKEKFNIDPLIISDEAPLVGDSIHVLSGFWKKGFSCNIENIVFQLLEDQWTFLDSVGYTRECIVYGGTSGSPIISTNTNEVIAINNTVNNGSKCTLNNPCEKDENGAITYVKNKGYGQNTFWIYECLNKSNTKDVQLNFDNKKCLLTRP